MTGKRTCLVLRFLELDKTWDVFMEAGILSFEIQNIPGLERGGLTSVNTWPWSCNPVQARMWCAVWRRLPPGRHLLLSWRVTMPWHFWPSFCPLNKLSLFLPQGLGICSSYFLEYSSSESYHGLSVHMADSVLGWPIQVSTLMSLLQICHPCPQCHTIWSDCPLLWSLSITLPSLISFLERVTFFNY